MSKAHVGHATGSYEWFTPEKYIVAARCVMGGISLDPATTERANDTIVKADAYYTKETNGLAHQWYGNIWMNPPYSQPLITQFTEKVLHEYRMGRVEQACILTNNATETKWFQALIAEASAICFIKGRVRFLDPAGNLGKPLQGQAVTYLGSREHEFQIGFEHFGQIMTVVQKSVYPQYSHNPYLLDGGVSYRTARPTRSFFEYEYNRTRDREEPEEGRRGREEGW